MTATATRSPVKLSVRAEHESTTPEYDEKVLGCYEGFAADVRKFQREYSRTWGWCVAVVTASYKGQEETTYLGGCSYESADDFKAGGYYSDMAVEALEALMKRPYWDERDLAALAAERDRFKAASQAEYDKQQEERKSA